MFYGTSNKSGRPKGSTNKVSDAVRAVISDLLIDNADQLTERMSRLSDADFIKCYASLARFVVPQQRAIIEQHEPKMPDKYSIAVLKGDGSVSNEYHYERERKNY
jgi:hypothetical protein